MNANLKRQIEKILNENDIIKFKLTYVTKGCDVEIEIGDKKFDQRFMIKGNDEVKIHLIFSNNDIKNLLSTQKDILLEILDTKGIFDKPIQDGNVMLYLISETLIVEINQLN